MAKEKSKVEPEDETLANLHSEKVEETPEVATTRKLSIARALNEVKLISKRIEKLIQVRSFVKTQKGEGNQEPASAVEFAQHAQSLQKLIENRALIKNSISFANTQHVVTVGQYRMTISAALAMKEGIDAQKSVLSNALSDYKKVKGQVNSLNEDAERKLSSILESNFGKDKRADSNDYDAIAVPFNKANLTRVVDEELLLKNLEAYENMIEEFESEVDFALSEANAQVQIEIPL